MIGVDVLRPFVIAASVLVVSGCDVSPTEPEAAPVPAPNVRAYVTGAALENLDANGHFQLPAPAVESPYPIISAEAAESIALGVIRTWYANPDVLTLPGTTSPADHAESSHGAPIDWNAVRSGRRIAYFAESHLEPLPDSLGNPAIRHFGPHFLVPLYVGATPVAVVGVAAYATNVILDERGFVRRSDNLDGGGEFTVSGVPLSLNGITIPPAPEVAVEFVFMKTGVRISDVPVLGAPGNRIVRTAARWRLRLVEPVAFERLLDGHEVVTRDVYVGLFQSIADARAGGESGSSTARLRIYIAADTQPAVEELGAVQMPLRPGYAVDLHEVRVRE